MFFLQSDKKRCYTLSPQIVSVHSKTLTRTQASCDVAGWQNHSHNQRHIPKHFKTQQHCCQNHKFHILHSFSYTHTLGFCIFLLFVIIIRLFVLSLLRSWRWCSHLFGSWLRRFFFIIIIWRIIRILWTWLRFLSWNLFCCN